MLAGLALTLQQCHQAMKTLYLATAAIAVSAVVLGAEQHGRLSLPGGVLENPNDLAVMLLMGLPFVLLAVRDPLRSRTRRFFALLWVAPILFVMFRTGSRGAFLALLAMVLVVLRRASLLSKATLLTLAGAFILLAPWLLPETILGRYGALFGRDDTADYAGKGRAEGSREERIALLRESIRLTMQFPIFGVGPGQFPTYTGERAGEREDVRGWRQTHNTYTQISSEAGLPALLLYCGALAFCLRRTAAIHRAARGEPRWAQLASMAFCLRLALVGFAVAALFGSVGYLMQFPILAGLTSAFVGCAEKEMSRKPPQEETTVQEQTGRCTRSMVLYGLEEA
jgi:O-antigen ligase